MSDMHFDIRRFDVDEFGARVKALDLKAMDWAPRAVCLHHTWRPNQIVGSPYCFHPENWKASMTAMRNMYVNVNKWHSGPHLFLDPSGKWVYQMTPLEFRGVHAVSFNSYAWGVETIGDFGGYPNEGAPIAKPQMDLIGHVFAELFHKIGVEPTVKRSLLFHRHDPATKKSCPGYLVRESEVLQAVREELIKHEVQRFVLNDRKVGGRFDSGIAYVRAREAASILNGSICMDHNVLVVTTGAGQKAVVPPGVYQIIDGVAFVPFRELVEHLGGIMLVVDGVPSGIIKQAPQ